MTKDDFIILRNSITMMQLVNFYGFKVTRKGKNNFIRCPFHGGGSERTPSLIIYEGYRGFYCRGCCQGGDVTKFVEMYENLTQKEAALFLSERFNIPISESGEISLETRQKAIKARQEYEQQIAREEQSKAKLRQISTTMTAYRHIIDSTEPFSDLWCYCTNKLQYETYKQEIACEQLI